MHVVVLPLPQQGHVNPCLAVAELLIPHGFTFTFVLPHHLIPPSLLSAEESDHNRTIHFAPIPFQPPPPAPGIALDFQSVLHTIATIRPAVVSLLRKLIASPRGVSSIIADSFITWSHHVASELRIPSFSFFTTNAHTFIAIFHAQILISKGLTPVLDADRMVDCVPGLPPMRAGDLPQSIRTYPSFGVDLAKDIQKAAGVIINTVYELEREPLEVIRSVVPIYTIGPMLLMPGGPKKPEGGAASVGLWIEDRECLNWLDTRPLSSVLFIAFGSLATMSGDQMTELAEGLEASGQAFLWVVRSDAVGAPLSTLLPEGFSERTKDRGLIIPWAPQVEVLSHAAVGGFLTHCGWNSVTENLSLRAVPMICWPQVAEQRLNRRLFVDKWKVGLELQEEEGIVKRAEVEKAVTQLIQGEVGEALGKRALELKERFSLAVQEGGSSQNYLKALGQDMKKLGLTS